MYVYIYICIYKHKNVYNTRTEDLKHAKVQAEAPTAASGEEDESKNGHGPKCPQLRQRRCGTRLAEVAGRFKTLNHMYMCLRACW